MRKGKCRTGFKQVAVRDRCDDLRGLRTRDLRKIAGRGTAGAPQAYSLSGKRACYYRSMCWLLY